MKAIIIDDEKHCREVLEALLLRYCKHISLVGMFAGGDEALNLIDELQPELVFLDIEMPGMNGFEFLQKVTDRNFSIIFTTAYNDYAIKAIKHSALDYLLKPVDKDELVEAVGKAMGDKEKRTAQKVESLLASMQHDKPVKRFAIPTLEGLMLLNPDEVEYVKSDGPYSHFYFMDGRHLLISKTLKEAEDVLPVQSFFRIHNSYLVNMKFISKYLRGEGGEVVMQSGEHIPVSRSRKQDFLALLEKI